MSWRNMAGSMPDQKLADKFGVSKSLICRYRVMHGIPAFQQSKSEKNVWTDEAVALLGTMRDGDLAKILGVGQTAVHRARASRGIAPHVGVGKRR